MAMPSKNGCAHNSPSSIPFSPITDEQYEKDMDLFEEGSGSGFLQIKFSFFPHFKGDMTAVVVYAFIINTLRMKRSSDRERLMRDGLWFRCPAKAMQDKLILPKSTQIRAVKKLVELGLIETTHRGRNYQWIKVVSDRLRVMLAMKCQNDTSSASSVKMTLHEGDEVSKRHFPYREESSKERISDSPSLLNGNLLNGEEPVKRRATTTDDDLNLARKVTKASHLARNIRPSGSPGRWADAVASLRRAVRGDSDEATATNTAEMIAVLEWYCKYASHKDYTGPVLNCASGLNVKFYAWVRDLRSRTIKKESVKKEERKTDPETGEVTIRTRFETVEKDGPPIAFERKKCDDGRYRNMPKNPQQR